MQVDHCRWRYPLAECISSAESQVYSELKSDNTLKDPEDVCCSMGMWMKVIQNAPASHSSSLVPNVLPRNRHTSCKGSILLALKHRENSVYFPIPMGRHLSSQGQPKRSVLCCPSLREKKPRAKVMWHTLILSVWSGEDMRKWYGEFTFELEAHVCKFRGERAVKGLPKRAVSVVATETQEHNQSVVSQTTKITSFHCVEGTSGQTSKRPDSEYSDQEEE